MEDPDWDFDDLNPPLAEVKGDAFFGCLTWVLLIAGIVWVAVEVFG